MQIEIREGYDIVITAENEAERKRLGKLNDKYQSCGLRVEMLAGAGFCFQLIIKPEPPVPEFGG